MSSRIKNYWFCFPPDFLILSASLRDIQVLVLNSLIGNSDSKKSIKSKTITPAEAQKKSLKTVYLWPCAEKLRF